VELIESLWAKMSFPFNLKSISESVDVNTIAIPIALYAAYYAYKQYKLKKNTHIESTFTLSSSTLYKNSFVSSVILVNLKDKTEAVFGIYLRLGHNIYIELERNDKEPILVGPFETVVRKYNPVNIYAFSNYSVDISRCFKSRKSINNARIAIASPKGKYITKRIREHWDPIVDHLRNPRIVPLSCIQATDGDSQETIPDDARFIILYEKNNIEEKSYIYSKGISFRQKHEWIDITEEDIDNQETLLIKIKKQKNLSDENIDPSSIRLINVDEIINVDHINKSYTKKASLKPSGWFKTILIGKLINLKDKAKIRQANRKKT